MFTVNSYINTYSCFLTVLEYKIMKKSKKEKGSWLWLAVVWTSMCWLNVHIDNIEGKPAWRKRDDLVTSITSTVGIIMYLLAKRRLEKEKVVLLNVIEGVLLTAMLVFIIISFFIGGFENSPLGYAVIPIWSLVVYYRAGWSKKVKMIIKGNKK